MRGKIEKEIIVQTCCPVHTIRTIVPQKNVLQVDYAVSFVRIRMKLIHMTKIPRKR